MPVDGRVRDGRVDRAFLDEHASFVDGDVRHTASLVEIGEDRCFALMHLPPRPRGPGFVVSHSIGLEFITLRRIERALSGALATAGHPVLALHRRGYGDSTGDEADATLARQVEDLRAGAAHLLGHTGVGGFGFVGAGFGGLVAGMAARRGADALVLVNPALRGALHFRRLFKELHLARMASSDSRLARSGEDIARELEREGASDILGFPVYRDLVDEASAVDLTADMGGFAGRALVMWASKRASTPSSVEAFRTSVERAGGRCDVEVVPEPAGTRVGEPSWGNVTDPNIRHDRQVPLENDLAAITRRWSAE